MPSVPRLAVGRRPKGITYLCLSAPNLTFLWYCRSLPRVCYFPLSAEPGEELSMCRISLDSLLDAGYKMHFGGIRLTPYGPRFQSKVTAIIVMIRDDTLSAAHPEFVESIFEMDPDDNPILSRGTLRRNPDHGEEVNLDSASSSADVTLDEEANRLFCFEDAGRESTSLSEEGEEDPSNFSSLQEGSSIPQMLNTQDSHTREEGEDDADDLAHDVSSSSSSSRKEEVDSQRWTVATRFFTGFDGHENSQWRPLHVVVSIAGDVDLNDIESGWQRVFRVQSVSFMIM